MKKPHFKLKTNHGNITFKPDDLTGHIAVSRQFLGGFGGWLPNPDPILRKMGKQIYVYRELLRDELVGSFVRAAKPLWHGWIGNSAVMKSKIVYWILSKIGWPLMSMFIRSAKTS